MLKYTNTEKQKKEHIKCLSCFCICCVCVLGCMWVHVCRNERFTLKKSFLRCCLPCLFTQGFSLTQNSLSTPGPIIQNRDLPNYFSSALELQTFSHRFWVLNSGPHICMACTLPTELSLQTLTSLCFLLVNPCASTSTCVSSRKLYVYNKTLILST